MAYIERQLKGFRELERRMDLRGTMSHACIQHDNWCDVYKTGNGCTCDPDIMLITHDGRKFEVDDDGHLTAPREHLIRQHQTYCEGRRP